MKRVYLLTLLLVATVATIFASPIPHDPELRHGVLANSLQYYIRHNALPKGQADFYIISDVGAIQEDDDQQGLAHFMEHMAFNGTKNLPGKQLIEYLESIGVKFGANLNASTSWDVTTYMMKDVPVLREPVVDSALLILHDWAGFIEPQPEEIDKERGVIKEELRTRDGAGWRSTMSLISALGRGTKYEERNLIGYLDYLSTFEHDVLTRFYHEWYRPEYQAIIIVGDVDVDNVEAKIKELFSDLPASAPGAPQKEVIRVPDNDVPIVEIFTDPEMQYSAINYFIKRDATPKGEAGTIATAREGVVDLLIEMMQSERFDEVTMLPDAPILYGDMSLGRVGVIPTLTATGYAVQSPEGELDEALRELVRQMERARRDGFYEGEFERAKQELMRSAERAYLNRGDRTNNSFVGRYISNYRFGTAVPSAEDEWAMDREMIESITLEEVNSRVGELFSDHNHVVMVTSPRKEGLDVPTKEEVLSIIEEVSNGEIEPYEDKVVSAELLSEDVILAGSSVVETVENREYGTTEWLLDNGIRVVVKPTKLKADEVIFRATTDGGRSLLSEELDMSGMLLPYLVSQSGVGEYSAVELNRVLAGHLVGISYGVGEYSHTLSGSSSPADMETLLQLLYLNFTSPRYDEADFETLRRQLRANVENQITSPDYKASERFAQVAYDGNIRKQPISLEAIDRLTLAGFKEVHDTLYSDADNFTFTIVGNIELDELKPLVERYIGSLPTVVDNAKMTYRDVNTRAIDGVVRDDFETVMEQPKVTYRSLITDNSIDYTLRNQVVASYFKAALDDLLLKSVREEMGGTYGVRTSLSVSDKPMEHYALSISFDTNDEQIEELRDAVLDQLKILSKIGATEEQMNKSREFMLKSFGNSKEQNSGWLSYINTLYDSGFDYIGEYEQIVNSITPKDVRNMARRMLRDKRLIEVVMHPQRVE